MSKRDDKTTNNEPVIETEEGTKQIKDDSSVKKEPLKTCDEWALHLRSVSWQLAILKKQSKVPINKAITQKEYQLMLNQAINKKIGG